MEAGRKLDTDILPFAISIQKPVIVAPVYTSAGGSVTGCVSAPAGGCVDWTALSRPNPDIPSVTLDLGGQANAYQAVLTASQRSPLVERICQPRFLPVCYAGR